MRTFLGRKYQFRLLNVGFRQAYKEMQNEQSQGIAGHAVILQLPVRETTQGYVLRHACPVSSDLANVCFFFSSALHWQSTVPHVPLLFVVIMTLCHYYYDDVM